MGNTYNAYYINILMNYCTMQFELLELYTRNWCKNECFKTKLLILLNFDYFKDALSTNITGLQ